MDNEINGFDEGVAAGGLRNTTQIKILFEYLADALEGEADRYTLIQAVLLHSLANYFEASQALDELVEKGNLEKDENGALTLTETGKSSLDALLPDLPFSVREIAYADAKLIQKRERIKKSNKVEINKTENGYETVCRVFHGDEKLMTVSLYAPDLQAAIDIARKFDADPGKYYSQILAAFYEE
jgi:predicted transcriptional regulator